MPKGKGDSGPISARCQECLRGHGWDSPAGYDWEATGRVGALRKGRSHVHWRNQVGGGVRQVQLRCLMCGNLWWTIHPQAVDAWQKVVEAGGADVAARAHLERLVAERKRWNLDRYGNSGKA